MTTPQPGTEAAAKEAAAIEAAAAASADLRGAAVDGLRWTSIGRVAVELLLLGSMVVLARLIPPAQLGTYAVAIVVQELAIGIQAQGVGNALVQRATADRDHVQAGHAIALLTGIGLAGLSLVSARLVAEPIFGAPTATLVALTAPLCIVAALGVVPMAVLRRRLSFRRLAIIDIVSSVLRVAVWIGLAVAGLGAKSLVLGTLVATAMGTIGAWVSVRPPAPRLRRRAARELLAYGLPASAASVSWVCFRNCDYAIVGARLGTMQAGLYFRAYQLAVEYQKKVSDLMVTVAFPVLSRSASPVEMDLLRSQMVRLLTMMLFPLLALLVVVAPVFIPWLLGHAWAPAVLPTQILAAGGAATLVIDTTGVALMATGRSRAMLGYGIAHFAVYAGAVWVVAPGGIAAVAIAAAVVHTAFLVVSYLVMLRGSRWSAVGQLVADVAPAVAASVGLLAVALPLSWALGGMHPPVPVQVGAVGAAGLFGYALTLRAVFPAAWTELSTGLLRIVPLDRLRAAVRSPAPIVPGAAG